MRYQLPEKILTELVYRHITIQSENPYKSHKNEPTLNHTLGIRIGDDRDQRTWIVVHDKDGKPTAYKILDQLSRFSTFNGAGLIALAAFELLSTANWQEAFTKLDPSETIVFSRAHTQEQPDHLEEVTPLEENLDENKAYSNEMKLVR